MSYRFLFVELASTSVNLYTLGCTGMNDWCIFLCVKYHCAAEEIIKKYISSMHSLFLRLFSAISFGKENTGRFIFAIILFVVYISRCINVMGKLCILADAPM